MPNPTPPAQPNPPASPPEPLILTTSTAARHPTAAEPGLSLGGDLPPLPPELANALGRRDRLLVVELVRGATWAGALDLAGIPPKATIRDQRPPDRIIQAAEWLINELSLRAAINRNWIRIQLVSLYNRACQAEPVLGRNGVPTGVYRFDGTTAKNCLELLGQDVGMFGKRGQAGIAPSDVLELLRLVAARGKPALPGDNARVIAASPQTTQAADSTGDAAQQSERAPA